jgi:N-terminal acetyltransferase B complex non-catalytic subunit
LLLLLLPLQIQWELGLPEHVKPADAVSYAQHLMQRHASVQHLYAGLDQRERGPSDELITLAAGYLIRAYQQRRSQMQEAQDCRGKQLLLRALLLLEAGVRQRPYSAPCRLALCWLYAAFGCAKAAKKHFDALDTKHIQMDTVASHHLMPLLRALGDCGEAEGVLRSTQALFKDHLVDAGDTLMMAYNHDTHTKVRTVHGCFVIL